MRLFLSLLFMVTTLFSKERIITLSPSLSEIVFALEKGDELVGVSSFAAFPNEVQKIEKIGGYFDPNLEKVLSLRPTLVIGQGHLQKFLSQLSALGIKTLSVKLNKIEDIEDSIQIIAQNISATNADSLVKKIENARKNAPKLKKKKSVLIAFGVTYDLRSNIYVAGHDLYFEQILEACNATNAFTSKTFAQPVLGYEQIVALDPDIVLLQHSSLTDQPIDKKLLQATWGSLPIKAAKNGKIVIVDANMIAIPSDKIALAIPYLCQKIVDAER